MIWIGATLFIGLDLVALCATSGMGRVLNANDRKTPASFGRLVPSGAGVR
jgi:hypothetical protein